MTHCKFKVSWRERPWATTLDSASLSWLSSGPALWWVRSADLTHQSAGPELSQEREALSKVVAQGRSRHETLNLQCVIKPGVGAVWQAVGRERAGAISYLLEGDHVAGFDTDAQTVAEFIATMNEAHGSDAHVTLAIAAASTGDITTEGRHQ